MEGAYEHFEKTLNALERRGLAYAEPDLMGEYRLKRLLLCKYGNYVQLTAPTAKAVGFRRKAKPSFWYRLDSVRCYGCQECYCAPCVRG